MAEKTVVSKGNLPKERDIWNLSGITIVIKIRV
jgi:hypothetical protein